MRFRRKILSKGKFTSSEHHSLIDDDFSVKFLCLLGVNTNPCRISLIFINLSLLSGKKREKYKDYVEALLHILFSQRLQ